MQELQALIKAFIKKRKGKQIAAKEPSPVSDHQDRSSFLSFIRSGICFYFLLRESPTMRMKEKNDDDRRRESRYAHFSLYWMLPLGLQDRAIRLKHSIKEKKVMRSGILEALAKKFLVNNRFGLNAHSKERESAHAGVLTRILFLNNCGLTVNRLQENFQGFQLPGLKKM